MKEFFTIGEISRLFGINVQTLYYYDSIGLFQPSERSSGGQRKYAFDKIYALASIRYMRKLGYSLDEIKDYMARLNVNITLDNLKHRSIMLKRQWEELLSIDMVIQRKIRFIEEQMKGLRVEEVCVRRYPDRRYIEIGREEILYHHDSFYFYPTIAFYIDESKSFGAYLYPDNEESISKIPEYQIKVIPEGDYLCGYHLGAYETVTQTIRKIRLSRPDLKLSDLTVNFNIVDQFVEHNNENYITNIQVRILGTNREGTGSFR
ncbi:MerR family transcriptional regulator [Diplocloster modestus]|uniref:MerR family transcriptional regulator n=1 Tax=Diplocloster modestus TaxID=2850322 RepID=A0ABS6KD47_9FIRM|nr:MerR family transcriptional regulator [Diplocloster modestus]MBU9728413.1 MerR family transcriptional regulator [Diplocloster modestus]